MTSYHYNILGKPIPLARPRLTRHGVYDSQKIQKENVAVELKLQHDGQPKWHGPVHLHITFFMLNLGSQKKQKSRELLHHYSRPDLSNLIKFVEDAAQGVLFEDDCIISTITANKLYARAGAEPFTSFYITAYEREGEKNE